MSSPVHFLFVYLFHPLNKSSHLLIINSLIMFYNFSLEQFHLQLDSQITLTEVSMDILKWFYVIRLLTFLCENVDEQVLKLLHTYLR